MSNFVTAKIEEKARSVVEVKDGITQKGHVDAILMLAGLGWRFFPCTVEVLCMERRRFHDAAVRRFRWKKCVDCAAQKKDKKIAYNNAK
mmetsp:Transcript_15616/g.24235  ORF Transcript_15616/g.24235 Transcript_15616/m.24235 type:complete len:89 (-) Transcript_15616:308-574(-)